jgi:hypothetical protein
VQLPCGMLPCWVPARKVKDSQMIELDVYYFYWLSLALAQIDHIQSGVPVAAVIQQLGYARIALEGMKDDLARGFPRTAEHAVELIAAINLIVPPVGAPVPNLNEPLSEWQVRRIAVLSANIASVLRDESKHGYILKVEDQRCLSSHALVENIEHCFSKESWAVIGADAKDEFAECGKCLSLERYTGAGFHALRGVECVIRQYIVKLTGNLPRKRDWGFYIETLRQNGADAKLIAVLENIRTLDRNPLMHPEDWLDVDDAIGIFTTSQTAVARLAAGIKGP